MNLVEKKHKYSTLRRLLSTAVAAAPSVAPAPFVAAAASVAATAVVAAASAAKSAAATATMIPLLLLCSRRLCHCLLCCRRHSHCLQLTASVAASTFVVVLLAASTRHNAKPLLALPMPLTLPLPPRHHLCRYHRQTRLCP